MLLFNAEQVLFSLGLFFLFVILTLLVRRKYSAIMSFLQIEDDTVIKLKARILELEREVSSLKALVNLLMDRIAVQGGAVETVAPVPIRTVLSRPVLLVFGSPTFGESDRNAMRKAGVGFFRLTSARLEDLKDELQRRRSDGNMYDMVHFSAHGTKDGQLDLNGQMVNGEQLSDVLSGVNGVFLSTCTNHYLADKLVGVVKFVVVVYEEIDTEDASNFVYEFYKRYRVQRDIRSAFSEAVAVSPAVSEFVDLRIGGV